MVKLRESLKISVRIVFCWFVCGMGVGVRTHMSIHCRSKVHGITNWTMRVGYWSRGSDSGKVYCWSCCCLWKSQILHIPNQLLTAEFDHSTTKTCGSVLDLVLDHVKINFEGPVRVESKSFQTIGPSAEIQLALWSNNNFSWIRTKVNNIYLYELVHFRSLWIHSVSLCVRSISLEEEINKDYCTPHDFVVVWNIHTHTHPTFTYI